MKWLTQRLLFGDDVYRTLSCFGAATLSTFVLSYFAFLAGYAAGKIGLPKDIGIVAGAAVILPLAALSMVSSALVIDSI